jgi:hypothetical protein
MSRSSRLPGVTQRAYIQRMVTAVRVLRVLLILLLAFVTISLVIGLGTRETGWIEKLVLVGLIAGCVFLAAKVSSLAAMAKARLQRP